MQAIKIETGEVYEFLGHTEFYLGIAKHEVVVVSKDGKLSLIREGDFEELFYTNPLVGDVYQLKRNNSIKTTIMATPIIMDNNSFGKPGVFFKGDNGEFSSTVKHFLDNYERAENINTRRKC